MTGYLEEILVAKQAGSDPVSVASAQLDAGKGIVGDRYHRSEGTFSSSPDNELTLIEREEILAFNQATGLDYQASQFRRNLVTSGIRLSDLVGQEFSIGDVRIQGMRLCEPCNYLAKLIGQQVLDNMAHKAGLRAKILSGGTITINDGIARL